MAPVSSEAGLRPSWFHTGHCTVITNCCQLMPSGAHTPHHPAPEFRWCFTAEHLGKGDFCNHTWVWKSSSPVSWLKLSWNLGLLLLVLPLQVFDGKRDALLAAGATATLGRGSGASRRGDRTGVISVISCLIVSILLHGLKPVVRQPFILQEKGRLLLLPCCCSPFLLPCFFRLLLLSLPRTWCTVGRVIQLTLGFRLKLFWFLVSSCSRLFVRGFTGALRLRGARHDLHNLLLQQPSHLERAHMGQPCAWTLSRLPASLGNAQLCAWKNSTHGTLQNSPAPDYSANQHLTVLQTSSTALAQVKWALIIQRMLSMFWTFLLWTVTRSSQFNPCNRHRDAEKSPSTHWWHPVILGTPWFYSQQVQTIPWLAWLRKQKQLPCFTVARI